jgi:hypothetical protein
MYPKLIWKKYLELIMFLATSLMSILNEKVTWYRTKLIPCNMLHGRLKERLKIIKKMFSWGWHNGSSGRAHA